MDFITGYHLAYAEAVTMIWFWCSWINYTRLQGISLGKTSEDLTDVIVEEVFGSFGMPVSIVSVTEGCGSLLISHYLSFFILLFTSAFALW